MSTITYKSYLEYIKNEFSKINPNDLSEGEKAYYEVVKKDLENSDRLPERILKSPVLPDEKINNETEKNIKFIRAQTGVYGKINSIKDWFSNRDASNKGNVISLSLKFSFIALSIIVSYFLSTAYPVEVNIKMPILSWQASDSNSLPDPTKEPNPLVGTAGEGPQTGETKRYTINVLWNETFLNLTVFIWGLIPIITILLVIYFPFIKWAWAK